VTWHVALNGVAVALVILALWRGMAFVRLALVAVVLAAALETPVGALQRRGWRRGLAVAVTVASVAAVLVGIIAVLVPRVVPQLQDAANAAPGVVSDVQQSSQYRWLEEHRMLDRAVSQARQNVGRAVGSVLSAAVGVVSFAGGLITVAALAVFLLASGPASWSWLVLWIAPGHRGRVRRLAAEVRRAVAGYVAGALVMGFIAGVVTGVTTLLVGVPYFLALAVLTAALGIVPFIGAIVSGIIVVVTTFATAGITAGLIALGVFVTYQQLEGLVLQPLVQRHAISMNPLVVVSAVLLGTSAAGVLGGVLALPLAAAAKVVANDVLEHRRRAWRRSGPELPAPARSHEAPPPH
jgi:predicted PurR-regulated permease PerM